MEAFWLNAGGHFPDVPRDISLWFFFKGWQLGPLLMNLK
jgi:hypothetical protein